MDEEAVLMLPCLASLLVLVPLLFLGIKKSFKYGVGLSVST